MYHNGKMPVYYCLFIDIVLKPTHCHIVFTSFSFLNLIYQAYFNCCLIANSGLLQLCTYIKCARLLPDIRSYYKVLKY